MLTSRKLELLMAVVWSSRWAALEATVLFLFGLDSPKAWSHAAHDALTLLCDLGWPRTSHILALTCQVLGLHLCMTMSS